EVVGIGRTARDVDHRPALQDFLGADGSRRIGVGGGYTAPGRTGTDGDDGAGLSGRVRENVYRGAAADHAVDADFPGRDSALDDAAVLPPVRLHRLTERGFRLMAGGRKERFVIVERDEIEDQIVDRRMRRAKQRLGAARALLELQPDDRRSLAAAGG